MYRCVSHGLFASLCHRAIHDKYEQIWYMRCNAHAWQLTIKDILRISQLAAVLKGCMLLIVMTSGWAHGDVHGVQGRGR